MTIAVGFRCYDGLVIAADTQETTGSLKVSKNKLRIRPSTIHPSGPLRAVFAGSGDAIFTDMVAEELWEAMQGVGADRPEIMRIVKDHLIAVHDKYNRFSSDKVSYEVDMLIGLWIDDQCGPVLLHAQGPAISEVMDFTCIGAGLELGSYIAARMSGGARCVSEAKLIAMYLLQQVKTYAHFCGGDSHIVVIEENGNFERVKRWSEVDVTKFFTQFEDIVGEAMLVFADANSSELELDAADFRLRHMLPDLRKELKESADKQAQRMDMLKRAAERRRAELLAGQPGVKKSEPEN